MQNIELILIGTFIGFVTLALLLLTPVYRYLKREEEQIATRTSNASTGESKHPPGENNTEEKEMTRG